MVQNTRSMSPRALHRLCFGLYLAFRYSWLLNYFFLSLAAKNCKKIIYIVVFKRYTKDETNTMWQIL